MSSNKYIRQKLLEKKKNHFKISSHKQETIARVNNNCMTYTNLYHVHCKVTWHSLIKNRQQIPILNSMKIPPTVAGDKLLL